MTSRFPEHGPDSKATPVPEQWRAECPEHGVIALVVIEPDEHRALVVRCYSCGATCTLVQKII